MDLRQLRHFLAVVEHGSILRAADAVSLTQPALSRSIQNLESMLDLRLIERGPRGVEPTPHGLLLARHARRLLAQADRARAELRGFRDEETPRLAVGVGTHLTGGEPLARVVASLLQRLPNLAVKFLDGPGEDLIAALQRSEIDVALCAWPPDGTPEGLFFEELTSSELVVVCRKSHPLARRRLVALEELAGARWAVAERPQSIGNAMRLAFAGAGLPPPSPVVRSTSLNFLRALLLEANLLSVVPSGYFAADLASGRLVAVRTNVSPATTRIGLLRRSEESDVAAVVAAFIEGIRGELRPRSKARRPVPS